MNLAHAHVAKLNIDCNVTSTLCIRSFWRNILWSEYETFLVITKFRFIFNTLPYGSKETYCQNLVTEVVSCNLNSRYGLPPLGGRSEKILVNKIHLPKMHMVRIIGNIWLTMNGFNGTFQKQKEKDSCAKLINLTLPIALARCEIKW